MNPEQELIKYEKFVTAISRQYRRVALNTDVIDEDDLKSIGMFAAYKAIMKHKGKDGWINNWVKLNVRQDIIDAIRLCGGIKATDMRILKKRSNGDMLSPSEMERVHMLANTKKLYLDERSTVAEQSAWLQQHELIADESTPSAEDLLHRKRSHEALQSAIKQLPIREKVIMGMTYRGDCNRNISKVLCISDCRTTQITHRAVRMTKEILESNGYRTADQAV